MVKIIHCNCKHDYQDLKYGENNRVYNFAKRACNKQGGWRCTVCAKEKELTGLDRDKVRIENRSNEKK